MIHIMKFNRYPFSRINTDGIIHGSHYIILFINIVHYLSALGAFLCSGVSKRCHMSTISIFVHRRKNELNKTTQPYHTIQCYNHTYLIINVGSASTKSLCPNIMSRIEINKYVSAKN